MNKALIDYIQKQLDAGYKLDNIQSYLIKKGYSSQEVREAIKYVHPPLAKKHHFITIVFFIAFFIIISVSLFYFITLPSPLEIGFTTFVENPMPMSQGDIMDFWINLTGLEDFFGFFTFALIDFNDTVVLSSEDSVLVRKDLRKNMTLELPDDIPPGKYVFKIIGEGEEISLTSNNIVIVEIKELNITVPTEIIDVSAVNVSNFTMYSCEYDSLKKCLETKVDSVEVLNPEVKAYLCVYNVRKKCDAVLRKYPETYTNPDEIRYGFTNLISGRATFEDRDPSLSDCFNLRYDESDPDRELSQTNLYKFMCYSSFAVNNRDVEVCLNLPYTNYKDKCILNLALDNLEILFCNEIEVTEGIAQLTGLECFNLVNIFNNAFIRSNASTCNEIEMKFYPYKALCGAMVARNINNTNACADLVDSPIMPGNIVRDCILLAKKDFNDFPGFVKL